MYIGIWELNSLFRYVCEIKNIFIVQTEALEETTVTDQDTAQPIEEASTQEVVVPAGTSDKSSSCSLVLR